MKNDFMIQFGFGFVQKMLVVQKHFDIKIKTKYGQQKKILAGASCKETAISAGISDGLLYQWVRCYKMKGYQGLAAQQKDGHPRKKKIVPAKLTPSEREEMIRLRAENERLRAEITVVKKEIALREERCAAQLKAKRLRSSKNSTKKDTD